jgi:hypothetical protein
VSTGGFTEWINWGGFVAPAGTPYSAYPDSAIVGTFGKLATRSRVVVASVFDLPLFRCGSAAVITPKLMVMRSLTRSSVIYASPLYGTCNSSICAMSGFSPLFALVGRQMPGYT